MARSFWLFAAIAALMMATRSAAWSCKPLGDYCTSDWMCCPGKVCTDHVCSNPPSPSPPPPSPSPSPPPPSPSPSPPPPSPSPSPPPPSPSPSPPPPSPSPSPPPPSPSPSPSPPPPSCGNDIVEDGEECEPPSVGCCTDTCTIEVPDCPPPPSPPAPSCGDGIVQEGEDCEPPSAGSCSATCTLPECGNGIVEPGEECEPDDSDDDDCNDDCTRPDTPPPVPPAPCLSCKDKEAGKPREVTLEWACDGAPPASVTGLKAKKAIVSYGDGVLTFTAEDDKLGSQVDFVYDGIENSLHTSCSAPFGIGVRTFTEDEGKKCQGGCEEPECTGCFVVVSAVSENGGQYCELDCADFD